MTPAMAAATAIATAIQTASATSPFPEQVTAEASYYTLKKPKDVAVATRPFVLVMPRSIADEVATRGPTRKYETTIRIALRHKDPDPDALDSLFDAIVDLVSRNQRFAGLAVIRVATAEVFDHDVYQSLGIVALNADVELMGYVTNP